MLQLRKLYTTYVALRTTQKIIYGILFLLLLLYIISESKRGGDFICYLDAAQKLLEGKNIYEPPFQTSRYLYHPLWATLLIPFLSIPQHLLIFIWNILNLLLFVRIIFILQHYYLLRLPNVKQNRWMWILIVLCIARFLQHNFLYGQMTVFILWSMVESVYLSSNNKETKAGILLAFAAIVKMVPVVLLPYFLFRKKWKAAIVAMASGLFFFFLPMLVTGYHKFFEVIRYWIFTLQPNSAELGSDNESFFPQNLSALLFRFLTDNNSYYSKNIFHLNYHDAALTVNIILLLLVMFTLYFLSTFPFKKALSAKHELYELSYMLLICPLLFPHQQKYNFLLCMPAIACLLWIVFQKKEKGEKDFLFWFTGGCLAINFILGTLTSDLFIGVRYTQITQELKTITIGTLLLIPALAANKKYFVITHTERGELEKEEG